MSAVRATGWGQRSFDAGSTSLGTVLLTPVVLLIGLMAFQAALWSHARAEARSVARSSAAQVARFGADVTAAEQAAQRTLAADTDLADVAVDLSVGSGVVVARVVAKAPGLLRGTWSAFTVVEAMPIEGPR